MKRSVLVFAFCLISWLILLGMINLVAGTPVYCNSAFPGRCTQGGCDAEAGWWAIKCAIKCSSNFILVCDYPPPN